MDPGPAAHHAGIAVKDARKRAGGAAQHPGNGGVPSTVPRVPDAVQRSSRCSAAPGSIQTPSTMAPGPTAHHAGIAVQDARKRGDGAAQHPENERTGSTTGDGEKAQFSQVMQRPG